MLTAPAASWWRRLGARFAADRRGSPAVEFAFIAPVLILLLLGMCDVEPALVAKFKTDHATETAADVAASYSQLQTTDMVGVYAAAADVMTPLPSTTLILRVSNIYSDGQGKALVYWSCGQGSLPPYAAGSIVTTTPTNNPVDWFVLRTNTGLFSNGTNTSYVLTESTYAFTAPAQFVFHAPVNMVNTSYLLPRLSTYVGFPWDGNSNDPPPVPTTTTASASVALSNGASCNYRH